MSPDILVILLLMVSFEEELLMFSRKNAQTDLSMYL